MLVLSGMTACGNTKTEQKSESNEMTQVEKKEETKDKNKKVRTITDHAGNEVEVPEEVEIIVIDQIPILSTYMAYHHGKAPYIVGYAGSLKQVISNTVLKDIAPELLDSQNTVQAQSDINIEEIMKLKPDVIFYNASNKEHYETLKKTGIPCVGFATVGTNGPAISMCGQVGWIGLIIPHMARMMVGANSTHTLPFSISLGASLMVLIEALSRTVSVIELPISVLTAIIGAPIFISLIRKLGVGSIKLEVKMQDFIMIKIMNYLRIYLLVWLKVRFYLS